MKINNLTEQQREKPHSAGLYLYTCDDLEGEWEYAAITYSEGFYWVHEDWLGVTELDIFHDGLIDVGWQKVA